MRKEDEVIASKKKVFNYFETSHKNKKYCDYFDIKKVYISLVLRRYNN